jgi:ubiquinone/menaquinone biosynthesis C-methylase UbiE
MRCAKCGHNTRTLDVYGMVDLADKHPERKRWQDNPEHRKTLEFYAWFIEAFDNARLLDVGAGPGTVAVPLSRLNNVQEVICFERDPEARHTLQEVINREENRKIQIAGEGDPWCLPFESSTFDVVICRYAMHHFADQPGAMREMSRCLKSGGTLLYSDVAMPEHSRDTTHGLYLLREDTFYGYRTYHQMLELVTKQNLSVVAVRPYDYQRGTLNDYLNVIEDGAMKDHLIRAWCGLDDKTKGELRWSGKPDGPFITYPIIDVAARNAGSDDGGWLCV